MIPMMWYDAYHDTLQLNENKNKGLNFLKFADVLTHAQSDFFIHVHVMVYQKWVLHNSQITSVFSVGLYTIFVKNR